MGATETWDAVPGHCGGGVSSYGTLSSSLCGLPYPSIGLLGLGKIIASWSRTVDSSFMGGKSAVPG